MLNILEGPNFHLGPRYKKERGVGGGGGGERRRKSKPTNKIPAHITTSDSTRIDAKFSEMKVYTYSTFSGL